MEHLYLVKVRYNDALDTRLEYVYRDFIDAMKFARKTASEDFEHDIEEGIIQNADKHDELVYKAVSKGGRRIKVYIFKVVLN